MDMSFPQFWASILLQAHTHVFPLTLYANALPLKFGLHSVTQLLFFFDSADINTIIFLLQSVYVVEKIKLTVKSSSLIMINNQAAHLGDTRGQNHKSLTTKTRQKWDIICIRFIRLCEHMVLFSKCQLL